MRRFIRVIKWVVGISLVLVLVVGGLAAFIAPKVAGAMAKSREAAKGPEVDVLPVAMGHLTRIISAPGSVVAKTQVNITSRVSAKIIELPFEAGDEVREGDIIVQLDSEDLQARLQSARARLLADEAALRAAEAQLISEQAGLKGMKATLDKSVADLERAQELFKSGDISEADLDQAVSSRDQQRAGYESRVAGIEGVKANVEAARAGVAVAQADVDQARENLEYATIRSPMTGVIVNVFSKVGEVALGTIQNQGATIMQIADLSEMLVKARVAEVDVAQVKEGNHTKVYVNGYPDEVFDGTVRRIALGNQIAGDGTSYFDTEINLHLAEGRRIFAGLTANVEIEVETLEGVMVVPSQAVVDRRVDELPPDVKKSSDALDTERTFTRAVFVLDEKGEKALLRPVRVMASNLRETAVSAGVREGDRVIIGPLRAVQALAHDKGVRVRGTEKEGEKEGDDVMTAEDGQETTSSEQAAAGGAG